MRPDLHETYAHMTCHIKHEDIFMCLDCFLSAWETPGIDTSALVISRVSLPKAGPAKAQDATDSRKISGMYRFTEARVVFMQLNE